MLTRSLLADCFSGPLVLTTYSLKDEFDARTDPAFEIIGSESRRHSVANDFVAGDIGECPFQAVPRLDPHAMVVDEDEEDDTVVPSLLSDLPRLKRPLGEIFDRTLRWHFPPDRNHDLIGGLAFKLRQLFIETLCRAGRNNAGVIIEVAIGSGRNGFRSMSKRNPPE